MLRDYQQAALATCLQAIDSRRPRLLIAGATGTGKSFVMLAVQDARPGCWVVTPNVSIVYGFLRKRGVEPGTEAELWQQAAQNRITTPIRFRNELLAGRIDPAAIPALLLDEAHHDEAETYQQLHALCDLPAVGFTGTPFRGTPAGTLALLAKWGEPVWMLNPRQALDRGIWQQPDCQTWALVDDDEIEVRNGELVAAQVVSTTRNKMDHLIKLMRDADLFDDAGCTRRGTVVTMPSGATADEFAAKLRAAGLAAVSMTDETPWSERAAYMTAVKRVVLVQVRTVGEGTDLPVSVMIDAAPTLSPVLWLQRFGRVTGRSDGRPLYVATNRNYMRHCYLLAGAVPELYLSQSIAAFGGFTERSSCRAFGLQSLGRLKPVAVKTTSGIPIHAYAVGTNTGPTRAEYLVLVDPRRERPIWFAKESRVESGKVASWGEWELLRSPPAELHGFKSANPKPLSQKQAEWWQRSARLHGLDDTQPVNAKVFQVLPPLAKYKVTL